jgi:hypothetical protein
VINQLNDEQKPKASQTDEKLSSFIAEAHKNSFDPVNNIHLEGCQILTVMAMESSIFWDITPCSPLKVN